MSILKHLGRANLVMICLCLFFSKTNSQISDKVITDEEITISGFITDAKNGEAIIGANIYERVEYIATISNNFGFFSLSLPAGAHTIVLSHLGYEEQQLNISESKQISIQLKPQSSFLDEIVVVASKDKSVLKSSGSSTNFLSSKEINAIPATGGEVDLIKALSFLPGIKQGTDGSAGFYVRGGGPGQNLILMDGVPLYNPYHLWGFLSTFNSDAINNIEVTKGAFPARYGGRLSSVLDVTMNEGNTQEWKTKINLGLVTGKVTVGGPLKKDVSSISISARRTFLDLIYKLVPSPDDDQRTSSESYNFKDFNLKYNYKFSNKDRIFLSCFYSRDKSVSQQEKKDVQRVAFESTSQELQGWGNAIASVRWNHLFSDKLFSNTTGYFTNYDYYSENINKLTSEDPMKMREKHASNEYLSKITDFSIKQDFNYYLNNSHTIRAGAGAIFHNFDLGVTSFLEQTNRETISTETPDGDVKTTELSVYIEDDFNIHPKLKINAGINSTANFVSKASYFSLQPRLSFRYTVNKKISFRAGYSHMAQYLHLLTSGSLTNSLDLWVPVTDQVKPQEAVQYSFGSIFSLGKAFQLEMEGYYKTMDNIIEYKPGSSFLLDNKSWEEKVTSGNGKSYGAEVLLQKKKGDLTGWIGYTLSWTKRQFDDINSGEYFFYKYDRRHDISIVSSYRINKKWSLNGSWVYSSGGFVTVVNEAFVAPGYSSTSNDNRYEFVVPNNAGIYVGVPVNSHILNTGSSNNFRLPNYHRMDIAATLNHTTKRGRDTELKFGLTNVYNKFNPTFFSEDLDSSGDVTDPSNEKSRKYTQTSLFPIMPTINYAITF